MARKLKLFAFAMYFNYYSNRQVNFVLHFKKYILKVCTENFVLYKYG